MSWTCIVVHVADAYFLTRPWTATSRAGLPACVTPSRLAQRRCFPATCICAQLHRAGTQAGESAIFFPLPRTMCIRASFSHIFFSFCTLAPLQKEQPRSASTSPTAFAARILWTDDITWPNRGAAGVDLLPRRPHGDTLRPCVSQFSGFLGRSCGQIRNGTVKGTDGRVGTNQLWFSILTA